MAQHEATTEDRAKGPAGTGHAHSRLCLLGTFQLEGTDGPLTVSANEQRLLAFLGLRKRATRTVTAGTLWPDVTEEHAHGSLRTALWRLRRARQPVIGTRGDTLCLADGVGVDVDAFTEAALTMANSDHAPGDELPLPVVLDGGELLPGWDEEWVLYERERLRQLRLHALESLSALLTGHGRYALALEAALMCVTIEPLRESAHRAVAAVHLAENNMVEVVRRYEAFRMLIHEELGLEPSARFTAMLPRRANTVSPRT
ncbi:BTAD domain-containing putative transcriptional regulator [Streptomyces sp. NPDC002588]|uniref:AfsR/SARP family transcriptional regulator n=1 Tax=Streptomyces sp. NPDC002588 TaxID=3154419 RepID=UPI00332E3256